MNITFDATSQFLLEFEKIIKESIAIAMKDVVAEDKVMTKKEVAQVFQVSLPTLDLLMNEGLPFFQRGQVIRFLYSEVIAWTRNNQSLVKSKKTA